ncbi:hypothetical protein HBI83_101800 [Parastagonospora nodorum]|nr:hypothetical protein HBI83_101800 [Parastagonospora nodorum]
MKSKMTSTNSTTHNPEEPSNNPAPSPSAIPLPASIVQEQDSICIPVPSLPFPSTMAFGGGDNTHLSSWPTQPHTR